MPVKTSRVCVIFWLKLMTKIVPGKHSDPLFQYPITQKGQATQVMVPVTYYQLRAFLKKKIELIGEDPQKYTLHGLRRAGATHALDSGLTNEDIKLMGDWASDAYMAYLEMNVDRRVDSMVKFVQHANDLSKV